MTTVVDRLRGPRPGYSMEFFPPREIEDERRLWSTIRQLESLDPAFVSITYGAGGTSRDRTIRTTSRVAQETTLLPMAHLTLVDHSVAELRNVIGSYAAIGVRNILAVRGDPPGDPFGEWIKHPDGLTYAEELVRLCRELGDFCVGVAAFPYAHPRALDIEADTDCLLRKFAAGADFAIAQLFHTAEDFLRLRDRIAARGAGQPVLPGVMPITTMRTFESTAKLSGAPVPPQVENRLLPYADDPASFRAAGIDLCVENCQRMLDEGVPALHFITFNFAKATKEVVGRLGLAPVRA